MSFCRCGPKFKYEQAHKVLAPAAWQANEAWYCRQCEHISHAVQEAVPVVRGPIDARALLHANGKLNGQTFLTWAIGYQNSKDRTQVQTIEFFPWHRRYPMTETEPLIFKTWELLMRKVEILMDKSIDPLTTMEAKQQARGIAEVLAIQMKPFMESSDHVVKCAVAKYRDPEFAVPGLGEHLWDPMKNPDGSDRVPVTTRAVKMAPKARPKVNNASTKKLTDKEAEGIREAISSGMFTEEDIASMFNVSVATVKEAVGA